MYITTTPQLIAHKEKSWSSWKMVPMSMMIMGEELSWKFFYQTRHLYGNLLECQFLLECEQNSLNSFSLVHYDLDLMSSEGPYLLNKWYTKHLHDSDLRFPLKIKVQTGKAPENYLTMRRMYNDDSGDIEV